VPLGASRRNLPSYRDIQVSGLECPPQPVLNNQAKITANIESIGLAGRVVKVFLEEDGKVVAQTDPTLTSGVEAQPVSFQFLPTTKGRHTYAVRVPVLAEEAIPQHNQRSVLAQVVDARIRVLYLKGALRAEYEALVERFFSKDPDLEFCTLVQTRPNVFVQRSNIQGMNLQAIPSEPAVLDKFNAFVLGDLDSGFLKPAQMHLLAKRVRAGAGLVMLGGYNSLGPGGYSGTEDCSFLLIDGKQVVAAPGAHGPVQDARIQGVMQLSKGPHAFEYFHAASGGHACMLAAWQPPGQKSRKSSRRRRFIPPRLLI
jgi:hypothetical protein